MANYSNQLHIRLKDVEKITHTPKDGNCFCPVINFKYEAAAMRRLNGNAYKIWRFLLRWNGKGSFFFSPAAIQKELGVGENGATTARKELERCGYLTKVEDKNNVYIFCPVLPEDYEILKNTKDLEE